MDQRVPYPALRAGERKARAAFPGALSIKALWTPTNDDAVTVEIQHSPDRTRVVPVSVIP